MFRDSNIILFLLCIIPIAFYSFLVFANSPPSAIRTKTSFNYLYSGLLSIIVLQFISFIFPHLHDNFFQDIIYSFKVEKTTFSVFKPTLNSVILFAFVQIALMEETSKWIAFKCTDLVRGKRKKNLDHPYAIIFYSCLVSAGFALVENVQYANKAISGDFGQQTPERILIIRAMSSVIIHITSGIFMGFFIANSKGCSTIKKVFANITGIIAATILHGMYDFTLMKPNAALGNYIISKNFQIHVPSTVVVIYAITISFLLSWYLKNKEVRR